MEPNEIATTVRAALACGDREAFRRALLTVSPLDRDAWVDRVLGIELADDGPDLPRDCVPYLPCSVDTLLRTVEAAAIGPNDVFVDIGSGVGRAAVLVHLLTGASTIGIEIQRTLVEQSRRLAARFGVRMATIEGDASVLAGFMMNGTVFFFYCPFSGPRLDRALDGLEAIATTRPLVVCSVDAPLPPRPWLVPAPARGSDLAVYRSVTS